MVLRLRRAHQILADELLHTVSKCVLLHLDVVGGVVLVRVVVPRPFVILAARAPTVSFRRAVAVLLGKIIVVLALVYLYDHILVLEPPVIDGLRLRANILISTLVDIRELQVLLYSIVILWLWLFGSLSLFLAFLESRRLQRHNS